MKNKILRLILAVSCLALLLYAFMRESHKSYSLADKEKSIKLNARAFTETTTFDGLMLKDGRLYDIYSLTPERLQEKDCAT